MKKYLLTVLVSTAISIGVFLYVYFSETNQLPDLKANLDLFLVNILTINFLGFILPGLSNKISSVFPWKQSFGKRYFTGLVLYLVVGYASIGLLGILYMYLPGSAVKPGELMETNVDVIYKIAILYGFLIFIYTLLDLAIFSYKYYAYEQINSIKNTSERLTLQLSALKKQLSPHFLFNSLNTASSLIYRDTETAELFVRKLVDSYQKILDSVYYNLIPLSKELEIVEAYKYLMEIRYEQALKIDINIPEELHQSPIPPLSLQLLVENAVKHNLINDDKPLYIEIYKEQGDYLTIANNLNDKNFYIKVNNALIENPELKSSGVGLENIKNRYGFYSNKPVLIEKRGCFKVQLPILKTDIGESNKNFAGKQKINQPVL